MNVSPHEFLPEEVMAFLDGELLPERAATISAHLEACVDCKELMAQLRSTSQSLSEWQTSVLKGSLQEHVLNVASSQPLTAARPAWPLYVQRLFSRRLPWALACLVMALLIGIRLTTFRYARSIPVDKAEAYRSVLLTNPPTPGTTYGPGSAADKAAGGGGAEDENAFSVNFGAQGAQRKLEQKTVPLNGRSYQTLVQLTPGVVMPGPMIARTVSLSIVVKNFDAGRASLDAILARHNGYAANLSVSTPQDSARVIQASLRIPAPQLAAALSELKSLGRVEAEAQNGEEVTQQHADLVARIKNDRETEVRLQDILQTRTGKVKDVLDVEQEIARVRGEIEQMEAEQKALEHRVDFAAIDLKLAEEYKAQLNTPAPSVLMQVRNAAVNGFRNAFESLLSLVLFLAESGPSLLLWLGLLGIPAWRLWKRYRRAQALAPLAGA